MGVSPKILMLNGALTSVSETIHKAHKARKFDLLARQPNPDMAANGPIHVQGRFTDEFLGDELGISFFEEDKMTDWMLPVLAIGIFAAQGANLLDPSNSKRGTHTQHWQVS
jgi:hypothetical protein